MAFNKNKALESALKYLNQGKFAQAIGEYQQILRQDPKDQATLMTVGDLFARQGDMSHAIEYFERLANVYLADGFNSKAIAIYKKIAKLAPTELGPLERLADLYVQQGVLSEARPLFLQIAEVHLKANRSQRAVEVLQRLLAVEPDNPRVQMRLAELYNIMGQKKEAAQTYIAYAQHLLERGEAAEAEKVVERALEVEPSNPTALLLKGKALAGAKDYANAVKVLGKHPEAESGGDVADLIVELEIESGRTANAIDYARKQLARGHQHFGPLLKITDALIASRKAVEALELLRELREPMIEAGEQDKFVKSLTTLTQEVPDSAEGLELLVDYCRHTSDPFRLNSALSQLSDLYTSQANYARAEELLQELVDRNKNDERLVEKLNELRARSSGTFQAVSTPAAVPDSAPAPEMPVGPFTIPAPEAGSSEAQSTPSSVADPELDEDTQRYIAQALTDVDLFSSYGLTQKATHLLEHVLQRAPRHTPTLERLLDLYLGAGNEKRTAETASLLEQIHRQRDDATTAEHFSELRKRFQKAAGLGDEDMPKAPAPGASAAAEPDIPAPPAAGPIPPSPVEAAAPAEFEVPLAAGKPEPEDLPAPQEHAQPVEEERPATEVTAEAGTAAEEVDLSEEWEAMARETVAPPEAAAETNDLPSPEVSEEASEQPVEVAETEIAQEPVEPETPPEETIEVIESPAAEEVPAASNGDFAIPPVEAVSGGREHVVATDDFISQLVAEIDQADEPAPLDVPMPPVQPSPAVVAQASSPRPQPAHRARVPARPAPISPPAAEPPPQDLSGQTTAESLNELSEIFQEFRSELGEIDTEEEDLETHYNLGIAYREMGLLDEGIAEFQKVAKAVDRGKPFAYAMNCATFLALSFMDKGQAKVASFWYQRALETPGIDQETKLALRYDLAVAQESAGESKSALDSFQQVYAMNIDYRDVADRIAALQKQPTRV
ncbi:MAG TPA: tetratricopeptide repeat protein [Candidatus Cybelea sp.]|nr:tetratricopeptide repeat protein [Candidatus Cybelea sp.]